MTIETLTRAEALDRYRAVSAAFRSVSDRLQRDLYAAIRDERKAAGTYHGRASIRAIRAAVHPRLVEHPEMVAAKQAVTAAHETLAAIDLAAWRNPDHAPETRYPIASAS